MLEKILLGPEHEIAFSISGNPAATECLLLLNGSILNLFQWDILLTHGFLPLLGQRFKIIRYDYGLIGHSTSPSKQWDIQALVDELFLFLDALKINRCHCYGLSKGTGLMLLAATQHPERFQSLAGYGWLNPCYSKQAEFLKLLKRRLRKFDALDQISDEPLTEPLYHKLWETVYKEFLLGSSTNQSLRDRLIRWWLKQEIFQIMAPTSVKTMYDWFQYALENLPSWDQMLVHQLSQLEGLPLLIQHSRFDRVLPCQMAEELGELLPNAQLQLYGSGYNHISPAFRKPQARQIISDYREFLTNLGS